MTPTLKSSRISEVRDEAEDRFDQSPSLNGPRMSALDPELRKRISGVGEEDRMMVFFD